MQSTNLITFSTTYYYKTTHKKSCDEPIDSFYSVKTEGSYSIETEKKSETSNSVSLVFSDPNPAFTFVKPIDKETFLKRVESNNQTKSDIKNESVDQKLRRALTTFTERREEDIVDALVNGAIPDDLKQTFDLYSRPDQSSWGPSHETHSFISLLIKHGKFEAAERLKNLGAPLPPERCSKNDYKNKPTQNYFERIIRRPHELYLALAHNPYLTHEKDEDNHTLLYSIIDSNLNVCLFQNEKSHPGFIEKETTQIIQLFDIFFIAGNVNLHLENEKDNNSIHLISKNIAIAISEAKANAPSSDIVPRLEIMHKKLNQYLFTKGIE